MRLLAIILFVSLFVGCADNNSAIRGIKAFDAEDYATAHGELAPLAARGNSEAQFYIAKMNHFGFGIPKDLDIAFVRYTDSAEQGYAKAQHNLGFMYVNGLSVQANPELGYEWISKAAAQGFVLSQFWMGVALTRQDSPLEQDIARGLEYYKAAADQNHPEAFTLLGEHFAFIEVDHVKAAEYFDKAAALGDPQAMHRLSYYYMSGTEHAKDTEKAYSLIKASAEKMYLPSYYDLGMSYLSGNGVTQNIESAIIWLKKSAIEANDPRAMESLAQTQLDLRSRYITQVRDLDSIESGVELRKKAAQLGEPDAQYNLFIHYYNGYHMPVNKTEAIRWLKASAESGHSAGQYELGRNYLDGWGDLPRDTQKGVSLYMASAQSGYPRAIMALGACYFGGVGVEKNVAIALEWFKKAPEKDAAHMIGLVYARGGNGVPLNRDLAEKWLRKSNNLEAMAILPNLYLHKSFGPVNLNKALSVALELEPNLEGESRMIVQAALMVVYQLNNNVDKKFYWLNKLSETGDAEYQALLGIYLFIGDGIKKNTRRGVQLITKAANNGAIDAQYFLGLLYSIEIEDGGVGVDTTKAKYWLSKAVAQGDSRADDILSALNAELEARDVEVAMQKEIQRLERTAKLEKVETERRALEKQLAEHKLRQEYQARQPKRPSFVESFIGGVFDALGEGLVMYGRGQIDKELGIKSYDPYRERLRDMEKIGEEAKIQARREARKVIRMERAMKNLGTKARLGYDYSQTIL